MKPKLSLAFLLSCIFCLLSYSQIPQGFNYQAIARDGTTGNPITDLVDIKIAILSDDDPETIIREEQFLAVDPDEHGLFSLVVGKGSHVSGLTNFSDIDWSVTPKYIKTMIYYGGEWKDMGPAQLWSVPYAMYSPSTNPWSLNGSSLYYSGGNVGIGTVNPNALIDVQTSPTYHFGAFHSTAGAASIGAFNDDFSAWQPLSINPGGQVWFLGPAVGLGTTTPGYRFDVVGRSRFQSGGGSAGFWLTNNANTLDRSFIGMYEDNYVGLFGQGGAGWGLLMNVNNGNVGIGTNTPIAKLQVNGDIYLPYNSGNSVLSMSMGSGNTMFFKPEDNLIRIQSDHMGNPTILWMDKFGQVGVGNNFYAAPKLILQGDNPELQILPNNGAGDRKSLINLCGTFGNAEIVGDYGARSFAKIEAGSNDGQAWEGAYLRFLGLTGDIPPNDPVEIMRLNTSNGNVGIGTANPIAKLAVQPAADWADEIPLFEVKNKHGIPVLAVYNNGVKINIEYDPDGSKGPKGGFAIGGYDYTKDVTPMQTFMNITPDSIRFNINNNTTGKGPKGGFAIGGFGTTKGSINEDFMYITPSSSNGGSNNAKLGFEAGKNSAGPHNTYLGYRAGKGVAGSTTASNIFIGEGSGLNNSGGYSTFTLFLPGGGSTTVFNSWGGENVAVGNYTGVGLYGTFLNQSYGQKNVLLGHYTGFNLTTGSKNVIIGHGAGEDVASGNANVFLGYNAGRDETGSNKLYIDNTSTASPLIYGDFDLEYVKINGAMGIGIAPGASPLAVAGLPGTTSGVYLRVLNDNIYYSSSSVKTKSDIIPFEEDFYKILKAQPVSFTDKLSGERNIGFIAEDFDAIGLKDLVIYKDGEPMSLSYELVSIYNLEIIKDQQAAIKELKESVSSQENKIQRLEALVEKLMEK